MTKRPMISGVSSCCRANINGSHPAGRHGSADFLGINRVNARVFLHSLQAEFRGLPTKPVNVSGLPTNGGWSMAEVVLFLRREHDTENGLQPNNLRSTAAAWQNGTSN
jgi:hypothetical protein